MVPSTPLASTAVPPQVSAGPVRRPSAIDTMSLYSPTPSRSRMNRQAFSSPTCLGLTTADLTAPDSGYVSHFVSPDRWEEDKTAWFGPVPTYVGFPLLDGNRSPDTPSLDDTDDTDDEDSGLEMPRVPKSQPTKKSSSSPESKPTAFPRLSGISRPAFATSFYSESSLRTRDRSSETRLTRPKRSQSLRIPDRFVPLRDSVTSLSDIYRITKPVSQLSPSERLLRNDSDTPDAFCFRRKLVSPMASDYRLLSRSDTRAVRNRLGTTLAPLPSSSINAAIRPERQASYGSVWTVGGVAPSGTAVNSGRGHLVQTGTSAPLFRTTFSTARPKVSEELEKHRARLATALELDQTQRVLEFDLNAKSIKRQKRESRPALKPRKTFWDGTVWVNEGPIHEAPKYPENRAIPSAPFKVLDAPNLKDDFYCSLLAYSPNCHTLVIGLGNLLYAWSERNGVRLLNGSTRDSAWLTSVAFSSTQGCKAILAYGRSNRVLSLLSLYDSRDPPDQFPQPPMPPRLEVTHPAPIRCVRWRPTCTIRKSRNPHNSHPGTLVKMEDLLVGDELGTVYYYSVEWPEPWEVIRNNWRGEVLLIAVIKVHAQQICGLSWSPNGELFATGGNDNLCCLFETSKVTSRWDHRLRTAGRRANPSSHSNATDPFFTPALQHHPIPQAVELKSGDEKQKWRHAAAVKAIAFCPWQDGLVATGGGSNDKCIHFFHTCSGAALATISVSAQVTSLIWSNTRREIVATFGYAEPDHPYRIAIFSWPDCRQVGAIPWEGGHRALYAIPYPGPAADVKTRTMNRAMAEGCIVVAASDKSVKFHEVWGSDGRPGTAGGMGMLGGSEILEDLQGIDREGDVIR